MAWVCCTSWRVLASWRWEQSPQSMALMSQARSGYNGTSDITASAPPPASWRGRGRASASGYKVLMTEAQEASYTAAASERVFPVPQLSLSSVFRLIVVTMPGLVQLSCILAAAAQVQAWGGVFNRYKQTETNWNTSPQRSTSTH